MTYLMILEMTQMLKNLKGFLDSAAALAEAKKFSPTNLTTARLAPDMYSLTRQVQSACDTAKFAAARLTGQEAPRHEDTEQTMEELHARIDATIAYLEGFGEGDFEGALERKVKLPFRPGFYALGKDYLTQFAVPNFFFHVTTAYNILRHNGVELGKLKFIGFMDLKPVEEG